jgi:hypothetical protein
MDPIAGLFDQVIDLPNAIAKRRLEALIGLQSIHSQLLKQAAILMQPSRLDGWSERFHGTSRSASCASACARAARAAPAR